MDYIRSHVLKPDSHRLTTFRGDCRSSRNLSFQSISFDPSINDQMFSVRSGKDPSVSYTVQLLMSSYNECSNYPRCAFFCSSCKFCAHSITCSCPRMRLGSEMSCKHSHLVAQYLDTQLHRPISDPAILSAAQSIPQASLALSPPAQPGHSNPSYTPSPSQPAVSEAYKELQKLCKEMQGLKYAYGPQMDSLAADIKKARVSAQNLGGLKHGKHAVGLSNAAANAKVQPQRRLFSQSAAGAGAANQSAQAQGSSAQAQGSSSPNPNASPQKKKSRAG